MPVDTDDVRGHVGEMIRRPPPQASTLCIERYLKIPGREVAGEVLDQLFADGGDGRSARERPGRCLRWRDGAGRELASMDVHPVRPDFENALLPYAFAAIATAPLALEIWCDTQTLVDGRRVVERWDGRDLLNQYAQGAAGVGGPGVAGQTPAEGAALAQLQTLGCQVAVGQDATEVTCEQVSKAQPWMLAFLPLLIWFVPFALLFARQALWNYFDRALKTRRYRITWRIEPKRFTARFEGDGESGESVEAAMAEVVAVSFAPQGVRVGPNVIGALRVVSRGGVAVVPVRLPDLAPEKQQALGGALKELLQAAALRARSQA